MGIPYDLARISSILSLFGGIAGYHPLLIKGSKIVKIGPFCMETVALPAEKRNAGGFGGGGGGGVGGVFWGCRQKMFDNVTKIFLFLWKKIFGANLIRECPPDHPLLR